MWNEESARRNQEEENWGALVPENIGISFTLRGSLDGDADKRRTPAGQDGNDLTIKGKRGSSMRAMSKLWLVLRPRPVRPVNLMLALVALARPLARPPPNQTQRVPELRDAQAKGEG